MSTKPANQKRRNNDKRKEKSRVAARCRRNKEVQIFSELTAALPARKEDVEQLDKASIMRLAISYLKVRDVVALLPESTNKTAEPQPPSLDEVCSTLSQQSLEEVCSSLSHLRALDGFGIVLSRQGDVVYCSENIAEHLGVSQMEIMGQSVFEFSHPCEHDEIRDALRGGAGRRQLLLRFKCTLTGKGRNVYLKSASYKVIKLSGHLLVPSNDTSGGALVAAGCPIPQPAPQPAPRSSVLMNLLDIPRPAQPIPSRVTLQPTANVTPIGPQQLLMQTRKLTPHAATPTVTQVPKIQVSPTTANTIRPITNPMSPLSLSIDTSMYGVYGRNCSPAISPAQKERLLSPYSTPPSMSPAEKYTIYSPSGTPTQVLQSNCDPYLTNKSVSPSIGLQRDTQQEMLMDPSMAADFWSDADMILTAFDDVRL